VSSQYRGRGGGGQQKRTCAPPAIFLDMMDATISGSDDVVPAHARSRGAGGLTFHSLSERGNIPALPCGLSAAREGRGVSD